MAFLRTQRKGATVYLAIVRNDRRRGKHVQRVLQWLGRDPGPARLKRALAYWGAEAKPAKGRRRS